MFLKVQYIPKNPVSRVIQCAAVASENEVEQVGNVKQKERRFWETSKFSILKTVFYQVNTLRADFVSQGMNHAEGGWPKVLDAGEPTQPNRS